MPKKILYIVPHRYARSPGQRFRCEHFIPHLQKNGYNITYSYLLSKWDDTYFYKKGAYFFKSIIFIKALLRRIRDIFRAPFYDIIFVYREAFMVGTCFFEKIFNLCSGALIYDFDDSIWLHDTSEGNKNLSWLKKPSKTNAIISFADLTIVGNHYLAQHAQQFSKNVVVIPTTINTRYHIPLPKNRNKSPIIIGWTGTDTTHRHLQTIEPVLEKIFNKYGASVQFHVISNVPYVSKSVPIVWKKWSLDNEIETLSQFDIGIMPLPNDAWSQGKCGFKGLQYMSLEIPTVMSPVGINIDIISHSHNGFLAHTEQEWLEALELLIENEHTRTIIGQKGRKTIITNYSVDAYKKTYVDLFNNLSSLKCL
ncbi:MAG: glycosyltransferase family 4 protein [Bacteroidales bacterium]